jgi:hypothetical protein
VERVGKAVVMLKLFFYVFRSFSIITTYNLIFNRHHILHILCIIYKQKAISIKHLSVCTTYICCEMNIKWIRTTRSQNNPLDRIGTSRSIRN